MKLILSSRDFKNEKSAQTIIQNLPKPIEACKLLFFPNEKATTERIHSHKYVNRMGRFGFAKENVYVFDYDEPAAFLGLPIDVIFIGGGNTFLTFQRIRNAGFDKEIIRYVKSGVTYIGGSAGAHIASKSVEHVASFDPVPDGFTDYRGLGLFDGIFVCHYTEDRKPIFDKLKAESPYPVYALTDEDSVVYDDASND